MQDEWLRLREKLLFKTPVSGFARECEKIRKHYSKEFGNATEQRKKEIIDIISEISIDMQSYLVRWHLQKPENNKKLEREELSREAERNYDFLRRWRAEDKVEYIKNAVASIRKSSLAKLSQMTDGGLINNRWGNDSATGLTDTIRKGAILCTINPIMINNVRKENPTHWDKVRDELKRSNPGLSPEQRVTLMTMLVNLQSCREFRPIYEATKGEFGYVCGLQVNPRASSDAVHMAEEAESLYEKLTQELKGTPNVTFKIPGTRAGLETAKRLTPQGIGVTITANCSVDQHLAFGEVVEHGRAKISFLVVMAGRLDDSVRDELKEQGLPDAADVAKWASTAIIRRSYDILYRQRKYKRSIILTASLRGPWSVEGSITDEETPIFITIFPDRIKEYDSAEREIICRIRETVPDEIMHKLMKSKIFRDGYQVGSLTADEFDTFYPVSSFIESCTKAYEESVDYNR